MEQDMFANEENTSQNLHSDISEEESLKNSGTQFRHDPNIIGKIFKQIWSMVNVSSYRNDYD